MVALDQNLFKELSLQYILESA